MNIFKEQAEQELEQEREDVEQQLLAKDEEIERLRKVKKFYSVFKFEIINKKHIKQCTEKSKVEIQVERKTRGKRKGDY